MPTDGVRHGGHFRSCPETSALRFHDELERSLLEMHDCLLQGGGENLNAKL